MIISSSNGDPPSVLVDEGKTFTLDLEEFSDQLHVTMVRPRNVAALKTVCGLVGSERPERLSDESAFEIFDGDREGSVNLTRPCEQGRIGDHSPTFVRKLVERLDPSEKMPESVRFLTSHHDGRLAPGAGERGADVSGFDGPHHIAAEVPVPDFIANFDVHVPVVNFLDIVVTSNSTLVLGTSVSFLRVRNILCYESARIIQRAPLLTVDASGRVRGSLLPLNWTIGALGLAVDMNSVDLQPATRL
jgi:hypothetical protein